jgi:hypothetical protein
MSLLWLNQETRGYGRKLFGSLASAPVTDEAPWPGTVMPTPGDAGEASGSSPPSLISALLPLFSPASPGVACAAVPQGTTVAVCKRFASPGPLNSALHAPLPFRAPQRRSLAGAAGRWSTASSICRGSQSRGLLTGACALCRDPPAELSVSEPHFPRIVDLRPSDLPI